jgi:hypothetical protein
MDRLRLVGKATFALALCLGVLNICSPQPVSASEQAAASAAKPNVQAMRTQTTKALVAQGYTQAQAKAVTSRLTAQDLRVVSENPAMVQKAGDDSENGAAIVVAVVLCGLLLLAIAAAATPAG